MKKIIISIVAVASAFTFSNCSTGTLSNPYAPGASNVQKDTTTGALLGAGIGALVGNKSDNALAGALLGAGGGAVLGSAVGVSKDSAGN